MFHLERCYYRTHCLVSAANARAIRPAVNSMIEHIKQRKDPEEPLSKSQLQEIALKFLNHLITTANSWSRYESLQAIVSFIVQILLYSNIRILIRNLFVIVDDGRAASLSLLFLRFLCPSVMYPDKVLRVTGKFWIPRPA